MNYYQALDYLKYCDKNGVIDASDYTFKTRAEIIEMAEQLDTQADYAYEASKENFNEQ